MRRYELCVRSRTAYGNEENLFKPSVYNERHLEKPHCFNCLRNRKLLGRLIARLNKLEIDGFVDQDVVESSTHTDNIESQIGKRTADVKVEGKFLRISHFQAKEIPSIR